MTRDQVEQFLSASLPLLRERYPRLTWSQPAGSLRIDGDHVVGSVESWTSTPKIEVVANYYTWGRTELIASTHSAPKVVVNRIIPDHTHPAVVVACVQEIHAYLRGEAARMLADADLLSGATIGERRLNLASLP